MSVIEGYPAIPTPLYLSSLNYYSPCSESILLSIHRLKEALAIPRARIGMTRYQRLYVRTLLDFNVNIP